MKKEDWIPVKDKTPEHGQRVIVLFVPSKPIMEGTDIKITRYLSKKPSVAAVPMCKNGFLGVHKEVTHWMPLPDKPDIT